VYTHGLNVSCSESLSSEEGTWLLACNDVGCVEVGSGSSLAGKSGLRSTAVEEDDRSSNRVNDK
jgi:hypothetical protein